MTTYNYKAKDGNGNTITGTLDADDSRCAADKIREMGCWPLDIKEQAAPKSTDGQKTRGGRNPLWTGVSVGNQAVFFRQLSTMLASGMALSEGLDSLSRQRGMGRLPGIAARAAEHVRAGGLFSDVLAAYPRIFSRMQIGLIRAGEKGGALDSMVERVATYMERDMALRRKFSRITFYPKVIAVFILMVLVFVPRVQEIVARGWPIVLGILRGQLLPLVLWAIGIWIVIKLILTVPPVRLAWDTMKLHALILGSLTRKLAMSKFAMTMSILYSAGMPLGEAVELASDALGNEAIRRKVLQSAPALRAGGQLSEALRRTKMVPEMVLGMVNTGERTGNMDGILQKVSEYYDDEAATTIEKLGYVLFALLILGAGLVVAFIVVQFYTGYFSGILEQAGG